MVEHARARIRFTYRDYCLLPEEKRYELIEGELLMTPAPGTQHQTVLQRLFKVVETFVTAQDLGRVWFAPLDVILSDEDVVQPDLLYVATARLGIVTERGLRGAPDLAVEVLSQATRERDPVVKRKLYAKYGVKEYWLVDPDGRTVEVLTLGQEGYETFRVFPEGTAVESPLLPGFRAEVGPLFAA